MIAEREVLPPPRPALSQSRIADHRVPGPVVVLLWSSLVVGGYLWAGLKGLEHRRRRQHRAAGRVTESRG